MLLVKSHISFRVLMISYEIMTYRLHVHHVFDKMSVLVRRGKVKSWFRFCVRIFVSM